MSCLAPTLSALTTAPTQVAIIGGGPAGLFAAERLRAAGLQVDLYEAKGSVGRKFLIAGKGGLNLTHSDPFPVFVRRYRERQQAVATWLHRFDADALRHWATGLGVDTFIGSSGRVFPHDLKAAPLLRGWVRRLRDQGVRFHVHHRWLGWNADGNLRLQTPQGEISVHADATLLALGGGSWPQLGSDAHWVPTLQARAVEIAPLQPANCGFDIDWSTHLSNHFAGTALKPVIAHWCDIHDHWHAQQGECVLTTTGIEGSLIYALSADLRQRIQRDGQAMLYLDLVPGRDLQRLCRELGKPRGSRSLSDHLRRVSGICGARTALLYERMDRDAMHDPAQLAQMLKRLPLLLVRPRPLHEAISSAGGIRLEALDDHLMIHALPGVFAAGEMLDWEAPTGGYLLTACFASGLYAAEGMLTWLTGQRPSPEQADTHVSA